ncbi:MAG: hypothetical protein LJE84_11395 [Gammaproteobacteria bacterium]|nr:hypothetical protein [Gammaproteobacteria bacterium]
MRNADRKNWYRNHANEARHADAEPSSKWRSRTILLSVLLGLTLAATDAQASRSVEQEMGKAITENCYGKADTMVIRVGYAQGALVDEQIGHNAAASTTFNSSGPDSLPICSVNLRDKRPS